MYDILFTSKAKKQLKKLEIKIQERIILVLERIRIRPEHYVTRLSGDPGYKLRAGNYRIIMDIKKEKLIILILKIGHRKSIYKK